MKKIVWSLLLMLPALAFARTNQTKPKTQPKPIVFTHVAVIDTTGAPAKPDMTVAITGDRITAVGKTGKVSVPDGAQVVDATGKFLIPGLWDMHAHIAGTPLPLFVANGITGVRFMGGALFEQVRETRKAIDGGTLLGPRIVMVAPVVDGSKVLRSFAVVITNENEARQAVDSLKNQGDFLKVLDTVPREAYFAFADEARRQKISFVGHLAIYVSAAEASDAGQKSIEHLNGVLRSCSASEAQLRRDIIDAITKPGVRAGDVLLYRAGTYGKTILETYDEKKADQLFARFRKNGTWVCPTLVVHRSFAFPEDFASDPRLKYIPLSRIEAWKSDWRLQALTPAVVVEQKKIFHKYIEVVGAMRRAGVELLAGSDVGVPYIIPGFSLHDELALLVQAGLTPMEALQSATIKPAKFLGLSDSLGTVEKGKLADLVLLEANPLEDIHNTQKINAVVVNARFIPKSELEAMLANVEATANKKIPRVGILSAGGRLTDGSPTLEAFKQELRDLGYVEGQNIILELRNAEGKYDQIPRLASELIFLNVDVIVASSTTDAAVASKATKTIPIVYMGADPIDNGLIGTKEQPGGNITGITVSPDLQLKHLQLLKQIVPGLTRVSVLFDPSYLPVPGTLKRTETAARSLGLRLEPIEVRDPKDLDKAFSILRRESAGGLMVLISPKLYREKEKIVEVAIRSRLPITTPYRQYAEAGALISLGVDDLYWSRRLATYVDKLLKGAKPGDLAVEQSTKLDLVINLKTAKALGLTIPQSVMERADKVIQ